MTITLQDFLQIDLPALAAGVLACVACGLVGNFLVLRRQSLMGDAISHVVLPGIVGGFLVISWLQTKGWLGGDGAMMDPRHSGGMLIGAVVAAVVAAALIDLVQRLGRVEPGAAMGVVFSVMFAMGVILLEKAAADSVDLDADCVLYGQLEDIQWWEFAGFGSLFDGAALATFPREIVTLAIVALVIAALVVVFFKELKITSFDPGLASAMGIPAGVFHFGLMLLVAVAAVASFEAVGSILVIAMLICPAATARMLTDRLRTQLWLSVVIAVATAVIGYFAGAWGPMWLSGLGVIGWSDSLSVSGMMAVTAGALLTLAIVASPSHGVVARWARRVRLASRVAHEDLLGMLYRVEEAGREGLARRDAIGGVREASDSTLAARGALRAAARAGEVRESDGRISLTEAGRERARGLVRSHRLWEAYLVRVLGLRPDHVHSTAMHLEHVTDERMRERLARSAADGTDPHGKPIP
ncbi:MAG: metal ABC transporter permease [Phycisphaerales bacterium]